MGENQAEEEKVKSMEYHRQVLKGKLEDESYVPLFQTPSFEIKEKEERAKGKGKSKGKGMKMDMLIIGWTIRAANKYISPSDNIMSPCTQKLSALRGKQFGKFVPPFLFFVFVSILLLVCSFRTYPTCAK